MRLIDADELLFHKRRHEFHIAPDGRWWDESLLIEDIENAPTIDPVKHGRWIITDHDQHCELCGFVVSVDGDFTERQVVERLWRYCPNCGCRMDADE